MFLILLLWGLISSWIDYFHKTNHLPQGCDANFGLMSLSGKGQKLPFSVLTGRLRSDLQPTSGFVTTTMAHLALAHKPRLALPENRIYEINYIFVPDFPWLFWPHKSLHIPLNLHSASLWALITLLSCMVWCSLAPLHPVTSSLTISDPPFLLPLTALVYKNIISTSRINASITKLYRCFCVCWIMPPRIYLALNHREGKIISVLIRSIASMQSTEPNE